MKQLTPEEETFYKELEEHFAEHVQKYKDSVKGLPSDELSIMLRELEGYLALCDAGDVSDLEINMRFIRAKIGVIKSLLI